MYRQFALPEFIGEPTADGDAIAAHMRQWYEANRESIWQRHKPGIMGAGPDRDGTHADNWMLSFLNECGRVSAAHLAAIAKHKGK